MFQRIRKGLVSFYRRWIAPLVDRKPHTARELREALHDLPPAAEPLEAAQAVALAFASGLGDGVRVQASAETSKDTAVEWAMAMLKQHQAGRPASNE